MKESWQGDFTIERLGEAEVPSPIHLGTEPGDLLADFTPDGARVLAELDFDRVIDQLKRGEEPAALEVAGPRQRIYFEPSRTRAGIVTCGGLCPGLNNIIRGLVMTLHHGYGVAGILGFRYGYAGLTPAGEPPVELTPESIGEIHEHGGTALGTSRGPQDTEVMVDRLEELGVRILFAVGGDGTFRGALAMRDEVRRRGAEISVIGVPKTIDNDIPLVDRTFGFHTAVERAVIAIRAARSEALSADRGIGLVKLMGRHSGFIAATAALAARNANLVLIPELPFDLDGEGGLFAYLSGRFARGKSTVIVVAEGAGQRHLERAAARDASGNVQLGDIGKFLAGAIKERFSAKMDLTLKYIDPSYIVRSAPANSDDAIFCGYLAHNAVHAGMSGRTGMAVGRSHNQFTHIPLDRLVESRKTVDPEGNLWLAVLESTGQPFYLTNHPPKELSRRSFAP
ncbi:MAG: ATP-dependent 6-phosphofructokinase [Polyangia bacterium]